VVGQILDAAQPARQLASFSIVLQGQAGPITVATTNELGEFHFDFDSEPGLTLEIGVKRDHWISLELPDPKGAIKETTEESQLPETAGDSEGRKDLLPRKRRGGESDEVQKVLGFLLFCALWPVQAAAENRFIVRAPSGVGLLQAVCALQNCTVVLRGPTGALDGTLNQLFLVTTPTPSTQ